MEAPLKRCVFCGRWFPPDPRTREEQKSCFRKRCRLKRKRQAHQQWLRDNPDHFKDQYLRTKLWLAEHPGYLAGYRAANPWYVAADNRKRRQRKKRERRRADIQDALPRREIARLRVIQGADIQDTTRLRLDGLIGVLIHSPRADMQDAMVPAQPLK
jgi:hypothetical protein